MGKKLLKSLLLISIISVAVIFGTMVVGAAETTYTATVEVWAADVPEFNSTRVITLKSGATTIPMTAIPIPDYNYMFIGSAPNGTYNIISNGVDTGKTITVDNAAAVERVSFITVNFWAVGSGDAYAEGNYGNIYLRGNGRYKASYELAIKGSALLNVYGYPAYGVIDSIGWYIADSNGNPQSKVSDGSGYTLDLSGCVGDVNLVCVINIIDP